ncbi:hypothetical protein [Aeromonas veronii]|uniref:hypothetical protein n=1 Tax=Aeromonas veronii TaxID=654 RepID=UPI003D258850
MKHQQRRENIMAQTFIDKLALGSAAMHYLCDLDSVIDGFERYQALARNLDLSEVTVWAPFDSLDAEQLVQSIELLSERFREALALFAGRSHEGLKHRYLAGYMTDPHELDPVALAEEAEFFANSESLSGEFVIRPCEESVIDGVVHVGETAPESADYWGVYSGQKDGRMMWSSDHDSQDEAAQEQARLSALYETTSRFER